MSKIWLIARNTYTSRVRTAGFLFLTFSLPVIMIVAGAIGYWSAMGDLEQVSFGYVDRTGQLGNVEQVISDESAFSFIRIDNLEQAENALSTGEIDGFLLVPPAYFQGEPVEYYGTESPGEALKEVFEQFMRRALLPTAPENILERVNNPADYTYVGLETGEEVREGLGLIVRIIIPIILAIVFGLAIAFSTGQMGTAVVREKEQRAMEIVITSLRPIELVAGKVLGMSLLALTQFGIWTLGGVLTLILVTLTGEDLSQISIPWDVLLWALLLILPGYLLFAMIGAGLGIIAGDAQQAQQLAGFFGFFGFVPIWFVSILLNAPNGTAAVLMSLFPLTAPSVLLLRMGLTDVPTWQLVSALLLLVFSLVLVTWVVARIFRAAMLIYGQMLRPRQIIQALRQS